MVLPESLRGTSILVCPELNLLVLFNWFLLVQWQLLLLSRFSDNVEIIFGYSFIFHIQATAQFFCFFTLKYSQDLVTYYILHCYHYGLNHNDHLGKVWVEWLIQCAWPCVLVKIL